MIAQLDSAYIRTRPAKAVTRLMSYALYEGRPATTKGQWVNPAVFSFLRAQSLLPAPRRVSKPVFVIGMGRTGTTILGNVLSMHRDIGFLNEPKAVWHFAHGGEDLIGSYSPRDGSFRLDERDATDTVIRRMHRIYGWYLALTRAQRVVDKYMELVFRYPFVKAVFPDAKFIFLTRNGWDTCRSVEWWSATHGEFKQSVRHDWWGVGGRKWRLMLAQLVREDALLSSKHEAIKRLSSQADMAAVEWILSMREGLRLSKEYPDCIHTVRFEDLVQDPAGALRTVYNFCDLSPDEVALRYGCAALRPSQPRGDVHIDLAIKPAFDATMASLGYK